MKIRFLFLVLVLAVCTGLSRRISKATHGTSSEWADRVVANGGARPTESTIVAMEQLRTDLITAGISNKFWSLCVFVPDSLIAATTPLIRQIGALAWTNNNFTSDLLTVHGLRGNGTNSFLDTGILCRIVTGDARSPLSTNISFSALITEGYNVPATISLPSSATAVTPFFSQSLTVGAANHTVALIAGGSQSQYFSGPVVAAGNNIQTNEVERTGFISGNKIAGAGIYYCVASPAEPFGILSTNSGATTGTLDSGCTNTIPCFASRIDTTNSSYSYGRLSMAAIHEGLTVTECSNFWNAVKTCRLALGGGTGEPVYNWAARIANMDGSTIGTTTSNAVRAFVAGLYDRSLAYSMIVVNPYAPDNLTACRTPVIWQSGANVWTNNNFGATNLSVNGLEGNTTTKSFGTAINFATLSLRGFSSTSAGLTRMTSLIRSNNSTHIVGGTGTAANSSIYVNNFSGVLHVSMWKSINVNQDFIAWTAPYTNYASYISGNRTAANAIAMFVGTNGTHFIATNATGAQTGSTATITNCVVHAIWSPGSIGSWSPDTLSFIAIHPGLTQNQSSNLYSLVHTMRNSMGGGAP